MKKLFKNYLFFGVGLFLLIFFPISAKADIIGDYINFRINSSFSLNNTVVDSAFLQSTTSKLYFYFDKDWWNSKTSTERKDINSALSVLGTEFETNIYPKLTSIYGSEWIPGIDNDPKITILFIPMKQGTNGYFRNVDGYEKMVSPESNQREMIYINTDIVLGSLLNEAVTHEFTHLIEFNQKERKTGEAEDIWLNEARAEYAVTIVGYNDPKKSNNYISQRVNGFMQNPFDSLVEWQGATSDYGIVNLFTNYLVEQYGISILTDSLKSDKTGINSINYALLKNGYVQTFSDIFKDFSVAIYINDCSVSSKYCFTDDNLKDVRVIPFGNFLPFSGDSSLSIGQTFSNWSAHWQKFSGAKGDVQFDFDGKDQDGLNVMYITKDFSGKSDIKELKLDKDKKATIVIKNMGIDRASVIIIPSVENVNLSIKDPSHFFYYITTKTLSDDSQPNQESSINFPFSIDKPLSQMNREELLVVLLKVIIYLVSQGKLTF